VYGTLCGATDIVSHYNFLPYYMNVTAIPSLQLTVLLAFKTVTTYIHDVFSSICYPAARPSHWASAVSACFVCCPVRRTNRD
jgi:hypothetical protein